MNSKTYSTFPGPQNPGKFWLKTERDATRIMLDMVSIDTQLQLWES